MGIHVTTAEMDSSLQRLEHWPIFGLKTVRAFLFCFTSLPKSGKPNSPFFLISLHADLFPLFCSYLCRFYLGRSGWIKMALVRFCPTNHTVGAVSAGREPSPALVQQGKDLSSLTAARPFPE
jgi:hypothetical protein